MPLCYLLQPKAVFFTCMDSRMLPTRFTETHVGDMFIIRNAGNLIPHAENFQDEYFSCEPAGLELGCVVNDIRHIVVCGHSDCKAMNLLHQLQDPEMASEVSWHSMNCGWGPVTFCHFRTIVAYHRCVPGCAPTPTPAWKNSSTWKRWASTNR